MEFETVIGLEVHVQLNTSSKIFAGSSASFGAAPNTHIDPVTFGLPGALPVLNRAVVDAALLLGMATHCELKRFNRFARKHYFYPDLPKGYQISQFEEPICERGYLQILNGESKRTIGITRIHMEEDAGKSLHEAGAGYSLVDLNRAGVPLLEVVSEPDIRSPAEAAAYLKALRQLVRYLGISDGNMEEGSLRCDANVSLRPLGELKYGTRAEIKNLNSFRFVERALEYEIARQASLLKKGQQVVQETRLFDSQAGTTRSMRGKEGSADYRYFPDPDLPPLQIEESYIHKLRSTLPRLPEEIIAELTDQYELSEYDAGVLTAEKEYVDFFYAAFEVCQHAKALSNWISSEVFGYLNAQGKSFSDLAFSAEQLGKLIRLVDTDVISGKMAKSVFEKMCQSGEDPEIVVEKEGLRQITDESELRALVSQVLDQSPEQVKAYLEGNTKVTGFFVGQIMKATGGSANPKIANKLLLEELKKRE